MEALFKENPALDFVFVSGEAMTNIIFMHCEGNDIKIPADLKVVSYAGVQIKTGERKDKIAYIEQPVEKIGREAVRILLKKIRGESVPLKTVLEANFEKAKVK